MRQNIFITGAGRGLGKALAEKFIQNGYKVFGLLRKRSQAEAFDRENFTPVFADVSEDACEEKIRSAIKNEPIHLLINNAGISGRSSRFSDIKAADMLMVFNTHCIGVLRTTRATMDNLLLAKEPAIININSRMGSITGQYSGQYSHLRMTYEYRIAKAAQNMLSACIKNEAGNKINIFQVHPGRVKTGTAQVDANLEPEEAAENIYKMWKDKRLTEGKGITDSESGAVYEW